MRHSILALLLLFANYTSFTQDLLTNDKTVYTLFFNAAAPNSKLPMIGLLNYAKGDHTGVQIGLANFTKGRFRGFQSGLLNSNEEQSSGFQAGLLNLNSDVFRGFQAGLLNKVSAQNGFQAGLLNQTAYESKGVSVGLINQTNKLSGLQIGLINKVDTIESGVPLGLIFVGKGSSMSLELGVSEFAPVNLILRSGIAKLYTVLIASYYQHDKPTLLTGAGLGTTLWRKEKSFFSPEAVWQTATTGKRNFSYVATSFHFGFKLFDGAFFTMAPSTGLNISHTDRDSKDNKPFAALYASEGDKKVQVVAGMRVGLRITLQ